MKISSIYRHPTELEAEAVLGREQPYPEEFTLAERTAERMARARSGLAHVMTGLPPDMEVEQAAEVYCWLHKILALIDMAKIDAEKNT